MSSLLKQITLNDIRNNLFPSCILPYYHNNQYMMAEIKAGDKTCSVSILTKPYKDIKNMLDAFANIKSPKPYLPYYILVGEIRSTL